MNVVATIKSWNIENYKHMVKEQRFDDWVLISDKDEMTCERLEELDPEFVFFPHWSWIIGNDIYENFNCVVFHMTDLPFGRGGSPLQNLIARGITETKISAIKVEAGLDTGPVYMKAPLSLEGNAEEIYRRASDIVYKLIVKIAQEKPEPTRQTGEITEFMRRTSDMNMIPKYQGLGKVYDWIRMLDAEGYPPAFIDYGDFRLEFSKGRFEKNDVKAEVVFKMRYQYE